MSSSRFHRRSGFVVALLLLPVLAVLSTGIANATIVYDNGAPETQDFSIYNPSPPLFGGGWPISDSFVLAAPATVTDARIAVWTNSPYAPIASENYYIGTSAFGTDVGSGVASLNYESNTIQGQFGKSMTEASFTLTTPLSLSVGTTYWLTLTEPNPITNASYWAITTSAQAGQAYGAFYFPTLGGSSISPESFQLMDNQSQAVPEPASLTIWGSALLGLGALSWWRRKAKA